MSSITDPNQKSLGYLNREICDFRKMMGDRRSTLEELERAFGVLFLIFLNMDNGPDADRAEINLTALQDEFSKRASYKLVHG